MKIQIYKIALVEDDPDIQQMYNIKLSYEGFVVRSASNGLDGLALIQAFKPDLVLLDIRMPVMNGVQMLTKLRSKSWGATLPVLILTNISRDEVPSELQLLGVERYIVKAHYTPTQVVEIIREVLSSIE